MLGILNIIKPMMARKETPQSTSTTLANISGLNTSQNPRGLNTAPYQFSNVNQTNTWRQTNLSPTPSSLRQSITPPKQPHTVPVPSAPPLYPPGGLPLKPTVPEPVPSVILFSNAGNPSKPWGPESALTISTYSSGITFSKPTTSEIQSVPLFPSSVFTPQTSIQQSVSLFTPGNISQISSFTSKHISQTPAQGPSQNYIQQSVPLLHDSKPLVSCFPPQTISPKPVASESEQIPLFPVSALSAQPLTSNSGSSIPFFASRGPSTGAVGVESTLFTDCAPIESAPRIPLFSPADLASKAAPGQARATGSTNTYRRVGSKRAVYAPIPGLLAQTTTNTSQLPVQHSSLADYFLSSSTVLSPQHIAPKHINQSDSSQANSPFLSPVTEPPILPSEPERTVSAVELCDAKRNALSSSSYGVLNYGECWNSRDGSAIRERGEDRERKRSKEQYGGRRLRKEKNAAVFRSVSLELIRIGESILPFASRLIWKRLTER
ncbi:hypothetical protein Trydic_g19751 [Trypoxylus dichotomus]